MSDKGVRKAGKRVAVKRSNKRVTKTTLGHVKINKKGTCGVAMRRVKNRTTTHSNNIKVASNGIVVDTVTDQTDVTGRTNKGKIGIMSGGKRIQSGNASEDIPRGEFELLSSFSPRKTISRMETGFCPVQVQYLVDGRILLADSYKSHQSLKLFTEAGCLLDELVLEDYSKDFTMLDDSTAALTWCSPKSRNIQLIAVGKKLATLGSIPTSFVPGCIVACKGQLAVTCRSSQDRSVKLLTRDGNLIKSFSTLFNSPRHITTNTSGSMLYVDDYAKGSWEIVAFATCNGNVKWRYSRPSRSTGGVLATDDRGNVYACGDQNVHQVAPDGRYIRALSLSPYDNDYAGDHIRAISFLANSRKFVTTGTCIVNAHSGRVLVWTE
jgi:hypothetical protein